MKDLAGWLKELEIRAPKGQFELGLDRIARATSELDLKLLVPVIAVAGTNGKGSTCCYLETILSEAGFNPGCFYSPHLHSFSERIRINSLPVDKKLLCEVFELIEAADDKRAKGEEPLSYFEFIALAAVAVFKNAKCQAIILEVGLGGRLDAINNFDADVAVITSIGIDHVEHLGYDRETIAVEKAGIMRKDAVAVIGDIRPPDSLIEQAKIKGTKLYVRGKDFNAEVDQGTGAWNFKGTKLRAALPRLRMHGSHQYANASCALEALAHLDERLPISQAEVRMAFNNAKLPGRFEVITGNSTVVLDVAHNVPAAKVLAQTLKDMGHFPKTHAVFGAHQRKDIAGIVAIMDPVVDIWHLAPPSPEDKKAIHATASSIKKVDKKINLYEDVTSAINAAHAQAAEEDRIVVFGSFDTIAAYPLEKSEDLPIIQAS